MIKKSILFFVILLPTHKVIADTFINRPIVTTDAPNDFKVTTVVKNLCENKFAIILEQNICKRSIAAGFSLASYITSIYNKYSSGTTIQNVEMDKHEKDGLSVGGLYPSLQCRFDTIFAGALNNKRPGCWYVE